LLTLLMVTGFISVCSLPWGRLSSLKIRNKEIHKIVTLIFKKARVGYFLM
jgi:hypothetical protein